MGQKELLLVTWKPGLITLCVAYYHGRDSSAFLISNSQRGGALRKLDVDLKFNTLLGDYRNEWN